MHELKPLTCGLVITLLSAWIFCLPAAAQSTSDSFDLFYGREARLAPADQLYPVYLADPLAPTVALNSVSYIDSDIPEAGDGRYVFRIGGRLGLLRISPAGHPERGLQLNLHGTFLGMFDREHSLDNIGWDGLYGIDVTWRGDSGTALKLGINHDSSHVGDEYAERTGRRRIEYTRQEYALGISLPAGRHVRAYAEAGWAFDMRNDLQERWRVQAGLEFKDEDALWGGRMGYYAAADITSFEESDWDQGLTAQAGLIVPFTHSHRTLRTGLEYRDARSVIGEFSRHDETYWSWGLWIDL
ncbi:MAG: DUF1207 domain-containing protein [Thermodesulfobacteriota bacterium]